MNEACDLVACGLESGAALPWLAGVWLLILVLLLVVVWPLEPRRYDDPFMDRKP